VSRASPKEDPGAGGKIPEKTVDAGRTMAKITAFASMTAKARAQAQHFLRLARQIL